MHGTGGTANPATGTGGGVAQGANTSAAQAQGPIPAKTGPTRQEEIAAFIANPLMPEPHQVRIDHITILLALVLGGPIQEAAVKLLMPA